MNVYQPVDCDKLVITQGFVPGVAGAPGVHLGVDLRSVDFKTWKKHDLLVTEDSVVERISTIDGTDKYGNDWIVLRPTSEIQDICDEIKYIHLHFAEDFEKGQELAAGTVLGVTAIITEYNPPRSNSTKHHLHWETWFQGKPFNPVTYFEYFGWKPV